MNPLPLAEMEADLVATERDIVCLSNIVGNLDIFITQSHGEDRSAFRTDRLKYSALLAQAHELKQKIQDRITEAKK